MMYVGKQFSSFVKAKELMDYPSGDFNGSSLSLMASVRNTRKLNEAQTGNRWAGSHAYTMGEGETSLYDDIAANGVKNAVTLDATHHWSGRDKPLVTDGNHRIAAAHAIDPEMMVPVRYNHTQFGPHPWEVTGYGI